MRLPAGRPRTIWILPGCLATAARPPDATRGRGHPCGGGETRRGGRSCVDGAAAPSASGPGKARRAGPDGRPPWRRRQRGRAAAVVVAEARGAGRASGSSDSSSGGGRGGGGGDGGGGNGGGDGRQ